jgi:hypothetical protein
VKVALLLVFLLPRVRRIGGGAPAAISPG